MKAELKEITHIEDIRFLVDSFYGRVRQDALIGPIFDGVIGDRWPQHLEKMYHFWETVLLGNHTYFGSPFPPHAKLPIGADHFNCWLKLWHQTLDAHFIGTAAAEAKWRADKMAQMFLSKLQYYQGRGSEPLV